MPVHDLGYRAWQGERAAEPLRTWTITETGVRLAWRNQWLRRLLFVTWLPACYLGAAFFAYEQWMTDGRLREMASGLLPGVPLAGTRHEVWAWLLMMFFRYPQSVLLLLVVGLVAPPLVAQDVRSRAFLLYFSRPLSRLEYVLGKLGVVWIYVALITTAPALVLYLFAVLLSPDLSVVSETWDLPLRIMGASVVLVLPTTALALAFSSLAGETRYASFAWFTTWLLGWVVYGFLFMNAPHVSEYWTLISLYHTLGQAQSWVFGIETGSPLLVPAAIELAVITLGSLAVLFRRISAPMRV